MPVEGGDLNGWPHTDVQVRAFGGGQAPPLHAEGVGPRGTCTTPPHLLRAWPWVFIARYPGPQWNPPHLAQSVL